MRKSGWARWGAAGIVGTALAWGATPPPSAHAAVGVTVTKTVDNNAPVVGTHITFTIKVMNTSGKSIVATVTDTLNSNFVYVSSTGGCARLGQSQVVACAFTAGTVTPKTFTITVTANGSASNTASVAGLTVAFPSTVVSGASNSVAVTTHAMSSCSGPSCAASTPELGSGELLATGLLPIGAVLLYRRRRTRRATQQ